MVLPSILFLPESVCVSFDRSGHGHRSVCTIDACGMSGRETTRTRNARGKTEKAGSGKDMVHKIHTQLSLARYEIEPPFSRDMHPISIFMYLERLADSKALSVDHLDSL